MGKSKPRNRTKKNRDNPTPKPIKPPSDPELAAIREQRILPVLKDLQSVDLNTRSTAAKAITNIIEDTKCRKLLLREQIVRILFEQTLTDSRLETRSAGWGILRNLALEEEADFCIHLYRRDVVTAIEGVVRSIIETVQSEDTPLSKIPKAQQDLVWNLTSSITNLLLSLSEAQDEIVLAVSQQPSIIRFLFGLLAFDLTPVEVQNEALLCLTTLTEDNKDLDKKIIANKDWLNKLVEISRSGNVTAVASCGVLHNIFTCLQWFDHNTPEEGASDAMLIPTLVESMGRAPSQNIDSNRRSSSPDQILKLALEITASIATSLQEALEHSSEHEKPFKGFDDKPDCGEDDIMDDDDDNDGDAEDDAVEGQMDEDDGNGEMNDDEIEADMELVTGGGPDEDDETAAEELTLDRLVRTAAPTILLLARPFQQRSTENDSIHVHALSALNNIAWTVSSIDFSTGHLKSIHNIWSSLAQRIWDEIVSPVLASNTADIELASSITSLAWAVSRGVQDIDIKPEEQRKFMALYQASRTIPTSQSNGNKTTNDNDVDKFQSLGVKSIGVLGRLALNPAPVELNREIGVFLLNILAAIPETPAADAVEALNQIFDIYSDKSYDFDEPVFWGDGFYKFLEEMLPKSKKMAKTIDKRKYGELRARADEAVLNLGRFLKYKRSEKSQKD